MPLLFEMGLFNICISEEELAERIVYLFSEEMDALLDDDDILELCVSENVNGFIETVLSACGAYNINIKVMNRTASNVVEIWFSFTTSPHRSRRHMDFINIPSR